MLLQVNAKGEKAMCCKPVTSAHMLLSWSSRFILKYVKMSVEWTLYILDSRGKTTQQYL